MFLCLDSVRCNHITSGNSKSNQISKHRESRVKKLIQAEAKESNCISNEEYLKHSRRKAKVTDFSLIWVHINEVKHNIQPDCILNVINDQSHLKLL